MSDDIGNLVVIHSRPAQSNAEMAASLRAMADRVEAEARPIASYGIALVYQEGTIGLEYGGRMLTTLLGAAHALAARIEREL